MFRPSLDNIIPEVDLLNFINPPEGLSNIVTFSYPTCYFCRFTACYNGWKDWKKIKSAIYNCGNKFGFKLANNDNKPSALAHTWCLICNRGMTYREPAPKRKIKLKRK
jgi:hypothetical protein